MKIAYLGYDIFFPCLTALEESGCQVMEVFTFPTDDEFEFNRRLRAFARARGVPCTLERITGADLRRLRAEGCQAVFCAGYLYRVPVDGSLPIVNIHPSLLPVGRGPWPVPVVLLRGLRESGVTLHKMAPEFDTGDILLQRAFPVGETETLETLTERTRTAAAALCRQMAADFDRLWAQARPQGEGEYWPCPQKEDYTITRQTGPAETERILRAFYGFDCYLRAGDREYRIVRGVFCPEETGRPFGTVETAGDGTRRYTVRGGAILEKIGGREDGA